MTIWPSLLCNGQVKKFPCDQQFGAWWGNIKKVAWFPWILLWMFKVTDFFSSVTIWSMCYLFQIQFQKTRLDFCHVCKANKCPDSLENGHGHKLKGGQRKFLCLHYCTVALIKDGCVRSLLHGCMWEYLQDVCTSLGGAGRNAPCTASQFCRWWKGSLSVMLRRKESIRF